MMDDAIRELLRDVLREELPGLLREVLTERSVETDAPVDTKGAAAMLGICERQVLRLAKSGDLPHTRLNKLYRFKREDVLALLDPG